MQMHLAGWVALAAMSASSLGPWIASAAAIVAPQDSDPAEATDPPPTEAEREWQRITDEITPKLVRHRGLPAEERAKETFHAELVRIGRFVREHLATDPDVAASARVFMATQILSQALDRQREAVEVLRDVALTAPGSFVAALAALHAGQILLRLGDETALGELREQYSARADRDEQFVQALEALCRQVRLQPGRPFPELELVGLDGRRVDPSSLRGKLAVVLVFSLDHEASKGELETLAAVVAARTDPSIAPVGISLDRDRDKLVEAVERLKISFPIDCSAKEWDAPAVKQLGLSRIPATFLIDPDGTILFARTGVVGVEIGPLLDLNLEELRSEGRLPARASGG